MSDVTTRLARRVWRDGNSATDEDEVVNEVPVALVYNGISHAVMMATPDYLEDLALGFSLSEGLLENAAQLHSLEVVPREAGIEVDMQIAGAAFAALKARRRNLSGRTGCGLCGEESLQQLRLSARPVGQGLVTTHGALQRALGELAGAQDLKARTGGVHGAAWCSPDGDILLTREDVGRHNALDKLLGALARNREAGAGFALVSSRASFEMVAKAGNCGIELLAAVSAPTGLAVDCAEAAGMSLVAFLRPWRHVIYAGAQRIGERDIP
jgi:formate dehydrogenase accessory protein FdhD